jgi:hypothetical protein
MTHVGTTPTGFSFLEDPLFEERDGALSCRVRVRVDGADTVAELELVDNAWRLKSDPSLLESCPDIVNVVRDMHAKAVLRQT